MKSKQLLAVLVPLSLGVINTAQAGKEKKHKKTQKTITKKLATTTQVKENKKKKKINKNVVPKPKDLKDVFKLAESVSGGKNLIVKPKETVGYLTLDTKLMIKPTTPEEYLKSFAAFVQTQKDFFFF